MAFGVDLIPKYEAARTPSSDGESAENLISNMVYLKDIPILRTTKRMNRAGAVLFSAQQTPRSLF